MDEAAPKPWGRFTSCVAHDARVGNRTPFRCQMDAKGALSGGLDRLGRGDFEVEVEVFRGEWGGTRKGKQLAGGIYPGAASGGT